MNGPVYYHFALFNYFKEIFQSADTQLKERID